MRPDAERNRVSKERRRGACRCGLTRSATALDDECVRDAASAPPPRRPSRRRAHRERLRRDGSTRRASPSSFRVCGIKSEETPRTHLFKSLSRPRDGRSSKHAPDNERARDGQRRSRCCAPEKDDNLAVPRGDARRRGARGRHGRRAAYHTLEVACAHRRVGGAHHRCRSFGSGRALDRERRRRVMHGGSRDVLGVRVSLADRALSRNSAAGATHTARVVGLSADVAHVRAAARDEEFGRK